MVLTNLDMVLFTDIEGVPLAVVDIEVTVVLQLLEIVDDVVGMLLVVLARQDGSVEFAMTYVTMFDVGGEAIGPSRSARP